MIRKAEINNKMMEKILALLLLGVMVLLGVSCTSPGGTAKFDRYSLKAPDDRSLSREEVEDSLPASVPKGVRPKNGLAQGTEISVTQVEMEQPNNPKESGTIVVDDQAISISTGNAHHDTPADKSLGKMRYVGAGVLILGVALIGLRFKFPVIPVHLGIAVTIGGFVLLALPEVIKITTTIIYIVLGVGLLALIGYLILGYSGQNRTVSTLGRIVDVIDELSDNASLEEKEFLDKIKKQFSEKMDRKNKEEVDRLKTINRKKRYT